MSDIGACWRLSRWSSAARLFAIALSMFASPACSPDSGAAPPKPGIASPQAKPPESERKAEAARLDPASYQIAVTPRMQADGSVSADITTNIPGTIEVMVDLGLRGQNGADVFIGKDQRVRIEAGRGQVTFSTKDLPKGKYDVEVSFYPKWGPQDALARGAGVSRELSARAEIELAGSGASAAETQFKKNGQKWVMANVAMGDPWRPSDWVSRFGNYRELPIKDGNPRVLKAYYFPRIDVTLIINVLKREIAVWRLGEANG